MMILCQTALKLSSFTSNVIISVIHTLANKRQGKIRYLTLTPNFSKGGRGGVTVTVMSNYTILSNNLSCGSHQILDPGTA